MQCMLFVLPGISQKICESFRCNSYDLGSGSSPVLVFDADSSIDCHSDRYYGIRAYAWLSIVIYPLGTPLVILLWLARYRRRLDPENLDEEEAIESRKQDIVLQENPICTIALWYRPRYWFYEVANMARRLTLTSVVLCFDDVSSMVIFVLSVSIVTLVIEREFSPFINPYTSACTYVFHWQTLIFVSLRVGTFRPRHVRKPCTAPVSRRSSRTHQVCERAASARA